MAAIVVTSACAPGGGNQGPVVCQPGWTASCLCAGGSVGEHVCGSGGQFGACECGVSDVGEVDALESIDDSAGGSELPDVPEVAAEVTTVPTTSQDSHTEPQDTVVPTEATAEVVDRVTASRQLDAVRVAPVGQHSPALAVNGALVTHVVAAAGGDPAGFFLQADVTGPAVFVALDPTSLSPTPAVGDMVDLNVLETAVVSGQTRVVAVDSFARTSVGHDVTWLVQDLSEAADADVPDTYESELVVITATINGTPAFAGPGHVAYVLRTGTVDGVNLHLRAPDDIEALAPLRAGCVVRVGPTPLWRFGGAAEVSVYGPSDLAIVSCPADKASLILSEYVHGNSPDNAVSHALEFANVGTASVDLGRCEVDLYPNGSTVAQKHALPAVSLAPGEAFAVCDVRSVSELLGHCEQANSGPVSFSGDDAFELRCDGEVVDSFGQVGFDPGTAWTSGDVTTRLATLRRKCSVTTGDAISSDAFDPALEWDAYPVDTFDGVGSHCP